MFTKEMYDNLIAYGKGVLKASMTPPPSKEHDEIEGTCEDVTDRKLLEAPKDQA